MRRVRLVGAGAGVGTKDGEGECMILMLERFVGGALIQRWMVDSVILARDRGIPWDRLSWVWKGLKGGVWDDTSLLWDWACSLKDSFGELF